ncbi:MAG TPA: DegT/DnrJ/EryC1/StrS family aminotransferase [Chitinophagaceae bacterium]|jgi:perosamine synthetase|nr:DegT/DnrJ/EryC1/StrS family aminotransferase [Chitinophagaceae bacterium]
MIRIPVYQPYLNGNEKKYINECIDTNWISSKGKYVQEFEQDFAEYIGSKYATTVCNGTVALHLALLALDIKPNDEIIVPTFTYIASVNAITYMGATPIFVDSDLKTWQISTEDVKKKITNKTKAIMTVHLYGYPCDMIKINEIAKQYNLFVIEDCSESLGSKLNGQHLGTFGDIATFSFFGNKTITTGEGGMVTTNNRKLYELSCKLKSQGLHGGDRQYWHDVVGYNYRMTNMCAAIGKAQLEKIDDILERKKVIADFYIQNLNRLPFDLLPQYEFVDNSYWMFTALIKQPYSRNDLMKYLADNGIETRPTFYPAHQMPMYFKDEYYFPIAEQIGYRGINFPSYPSISEEELKYIIDKVSSFFDLYKF